MPNPYEEGAKTALAVAIQKDPKREAEFTRSWDNWLTVYTFYSDASDAAKKQTGRGISADSIASQMMGVDYNHPVVVGVIPPPQKLVQHQVPDTDGNFSKDSTGSYWARPGQTTDELAISKFSKLKQKGSAFQADPKAPNVARTVLEFEPIPDVPPAPALFTTAAPMVDNWSRRTSWEPGAAVVGVITPGGGPQIFSPAAKNVFALKPGQDKQLTPEEQHEKYMARLERKRSEGTIEVERKPSGPGLGR